MPETPLCLILSQEADEDLVSIYDYTCEQFGQDQAVNYLTDLDRLLDDLCINPEMGRERMDIREGLRSMVYESHVIFYRIMADHIRIVRVLHGSRDIPKFLDH